MSQIYDEKGDVIPVTVVSAEPNIVVQVRTKEKDKYESVQIGYGLRKSGNVSKSQKGHFKNLGNFAILKEVRNADSDDKDLKPGDKIDVSVFQPGDVVRVSGVTKGKGFQGAVKRHGFSGMPRSHGHRSVQRHVGSIGQRFPQHTLKGMRMAGHMGNRNLTIRGLKVAAVDSDNNVLALKGAVPGNRGSLILIREQK